MNPEDARSVKLVIRGRVQGVGYRAWLVGEARRHGVRGWVRNRSEGTVEALIHADAAMREKLLAACRRGPPLAVVSAIDLSETEELPPDGFDVRPTL